MGLKALAPCATAIRDARGRSPASVATDKAANELKTAGRFAGYTSVRNTLANEISSELSFGEASDRSNVEVYTPGSCKIRAHSVEL